MSAIPLLLGSAASEFLGAALKEYRAEPTSVRVREARVSPAGGARVLYQCRVRRADGVIVDELLVAATGDGIPTGAAMLAGIFEGVPTEIGLWRWPHDPVLPGLARALDPTELAGILDEAGDGVFAPPRIMVRGYRPGQRAVLEASDGFSRWFVKVVSPDTVAGLQSRHSLLADALPVPPILAAEPDGLVVLPEAAGTLLRQMPDDPPKPPVLQQMLDAMPIGLMELPRRPGHLQRVEQSLRVLEHTLDGGATTGVADEFRSLPMQPTERTVPVHGDFHDGQILAHGGRITGVLDVDTAGPGERADEWATMLGHLSVRGLRHAAARDYGTTILSHAERHVDAAALRIRTAAVILGLANGPFRTQRPDWREHATARLALAQQWLHSVKEPSSLVPAPLM